LRFRVRIVGLGLRTLVLYCDLVVELGCEFLRRQSTKVLLLSVDHEENLPGVAIFRDSAELGPPEVVDVGALEDFLVGSNDDFIGSLCAKNLD
jgi:hypothetical protein